MYKLIKNLRTKEISSVLITTDNAFIPLVHENTDYQAYLKWVSEGNVAQPADEV